MVRGKQTVRVAHHLIVGCELKYIVQDVSLERVGPIYVVVFVSIDV